MQKFGFVCFVVAAISLSAASIGQAGGWQTATKVSQYLIEGTPEGDRIYVGFESSSSNPDSCSGSTTLARVYGNTVQGKFIFASVLNAKAASQSVIPLLEGCDDIGRPILRGIWIQ